MLTDGKTRGRWLMLLPDNFEDGNFLVKVFPDAKWQKWNKKNGIDINKIMSLWQVYTQMTLSAAPAPPIKCAEMCQNI